MNAIDELLQKKQIFSLLKVDFQYCLGMKSFYFKKMCKIHKLLFIIIARNGIIVDSFAVILLGNT